METKIYLDEPQYNAIMEKIARLEALLNLELKSNEVSELTHAQNQ